MARETKKVSVLSHFFVAVVLDGLQRLSGLLAVELFKSISVTRQNATVPFIFSWAVSNIIASFSSILTESKYSEYVVLFGVLLSAAGASLCLLATDITKMIVFWGFMFGSGYGLASPHLSRHLKHSSCSKLSFILEVTPSLGVLIMPFALCIFASKYGLGSYLILSGIILHYLPLAVAAAYNFEIFIPNIKWRVRKKSNEYFVSKQEEVEATSIESFINSLEPDLLLKINHGEEHQYHLNDDTSDFPIKELFPVGRKRSETRGNDLMGLDARMIFPSHKTSSQIASEIKNYEKGRKLFEGSFNNKDIDQHEAEYKEFKANSVNCETSQSVTIIENNISNSTKNDLNLKNEILNKITECKIIETIGEEDEDSESNSVKNCPINDINYLAQTYVSLENDTAPDLDKCKGNNAQQPDKNDENRGKISMKSEQEKKLLLPEKHVNIKSPEKESLKLSPHSPNDTPVFTIPLDIKVHVEEYTFTSEEKYLSENFASSYLKAPKSIYRKHSNSILPDMHENINFNSQTVSSKKFNVSDLNNPKISNIYSISGNSEFGNKIIPEEKNNKLKEQYDKNNHSKLKFIGILKFIHDITSPVCLCIILITIIFEINLVILLTMFADFGNNVDSSCSDFKWILVAFGAGGFIGKFCCCKISRTIPEKSHTIGVVLFLLTGLSTAGVLYSPTLNWLAGFYCILGALEGGITYTIPKFILEYTQQGIHTTLSSVKSFLSGAAIICIPYVTGVFPDELGDYEFLLQTLSCSSVICAIFAYFLPYMRTASDKQITSSFKVKMETV